VLRALAGVPLRVAGNEHLPPAGQAWVLVANHQSYLDTLALIAALPRDFVYVAKAELQAHRFSRLFLERLDTLFVERFDTRRSAAAGQRLLPVLARGRPLALYPEGTFRAEPGLLPFRMGAFVTAARVGVPLLPVSIAGTRGVLRSGTWWPRHGAIQVTLHPPLIPEGSDWTAALQLRAAARTAILAGCGEPDLAGERAIPRPPVRSG